MKFAWGWILCQLHTFFSIRAEESASKKVNRKIRLALEPSRVHRRTPCRTQQKGGPAMQPSPQSASTQLPQTSPEAANAYRKEDLVYQVVTVAAILLVLCTLWLF